MASKVKSVFSDEKNPRGIPKAPFIVWSFQILQVSMHIQLTGGRRWIPRQPRRERRDNTKKFPRCSSVRLFSLHSYTIYQKRTLLWKLSKYQYMESSLTQQRASLEEKIPDIRKTLDMVEYLQERRVRFVLWPFDGSPTTWTGRKAKVRQRTRMVWTTISKTKTKPQRSLSKPPLNSTTHFTRRLNSRIRIQFIYELGYVFQDLTDPLTYLQPLTGKRDALIQVARCNYPFIVQTRRRTVEFEQHDWRSGIPKRATHDNGG